MEDRKVFYIDGVGMDSGDILQAAFDGKLKLDSPFPNELDRIWKWNDIAGTKTNDRSTMESYKKLITEEYEEFLEGYANDDPVEELDACVDMMWVIVGYMRARGWSKELVKAAIDEVDRSNFSKFIEDENGVIQCVKREDGKILKPSTFSPADIATLFV